MTSFDNAMMQTPSEASDSHIYGHRLGDMNDHQIRLAAYWLCWQLAIWNGQAQSIYDRTTPNTDPYGNRYDSRNKSCVERPQRPVDRTIWPILAMIGAAVAVVIICAVSLAYN